MDQHGTRPQKSPARLRLDELRLGKVDGKHEYLEPRSPEERDSFDAYLVPDSIDKNRFSNSDIFFIEGFRGTGKTSFLRWHAEEARRHGAVTDFVLFKTDLTEAQKAHLSTDAGISWEDFDPEKAQIAQDFKPAWQWFILHKIGEMLQKNDSAIFEADRPEAERFIRLLGLHDASVFQKAIGFMPKLEGMNVKVKADVKFFELELGGDFKPDGNLGKITLDALAAKLISVLLKIKVKHRIALYFDELETFYQSPEQLARDQRMVRDILFVIDGINTKFRATQQDIHLFAAVRTEVVMGMGPLGQEVDRVLADKGVKISWYTRRKAADHPLLNIVVKKIQFSERIKGRPETSDPIVEYFASHINTVPIVTYLLDRSFWKPRDIVWRITLAQKLFPAKTKFDQDVLEQTEVDYSAQLWNEIRYELSAAYSVDQIGAIEAVLAGGPDSFDFATVQRRFIAISKQSTVLKTLIETRSVRTILSDLYRLGAIGNAFATGSGSGVIDRWAFRGDQNLLVERNMRVHRALHKRLSITTGGARSRRSPKPAAKKKGR